MKTIKALIFDMGGVLVDLDIEDCKNAFKSLLGYDKIDELIDPCHQKGIYGDLEEGTLSAEDFRKIVLADSRPGSAPHLVDQAMYHILVVDDEARIRSIIRKYAEFVRSEVARLTDECIKLAKDVQQMTCERRLQYEWVNTNHPTLMPAIMKALDYLNGKTQYVRIRQVCHKLIKPQTEE
jgi:FMN phosphatase YigB (HAD superfamily)